LAAIPSLLGQDPTVSRGAVQVSSAAHRRRRSQTGGCRPARANRRNRVRRPWPRVCVVERAMRGLVFATLACAGCLAGPGDLTVGEASEAGTVCAAGATVDGIDVSHYQGAVDW